MLDCVVSTVILIDLGIQMLEMKLWFRSGTADMATTKSHKKRMYIALCSTTNRAGWLPVQVVMSSASEGQGVWVSGSWNQVRIL